MGITPSEVKNIAQSDNAMEQLKEVGKKRAQVIEKYQELAVKYEKRLFGRIGTKEIGSKALFPAKTLLKVCQATINDKGEFKTGDYTIKKFRFFATKDLNKIAIVKGKIGKEGAYGETFKVNVLDHSNETQATTKPQFLKLSNDKTASQDSMKREHSILTAIGKHPGIQKIPSDIEHIESGNKVFYHTKLMDGDLDSCLDKSEYQMQGAEKRLNLFLPMLDGLAHVHKQGYCHNDIKPDNCLIKVDKEGVPIKAVLADFGLAKQDKNGKGATGGYIPSDCYDSQKGETVDRDKGDVFAISLTMIEVLTGQTIELSGTQPFADPLQENSEEANTLITELGNCGIPKSVAKVLVSGLAPKESRPSAEQLKENLEEAIAKMSKEEKKQCNIQFQQDHIGDNL